MNWNEHFKISHKKANFVANLMDSVFSATVSSLCSYQQSVYFPCLNTTYAQDFSNTPVNSPCKAVQVSTRDYIVFCSGNGVSLK